MGTNLQVPQALIQGWFQGRQAGLPTQPHI